MSEREYRIAALSPSLSALCQTLHLAESVVAAPANSFIAEPRGDLMTLDPSRVASQLVAAQPTHILTESETQAIELRHQFADSEPVPSVTSFSPISLDGLLEGYKETGKLFGADGETPAQRIKAQLFDWLNNFNDRMRHKRVVILSSLEPLSVACGYLPDLIRSCGGVPAVEKPIVGEIQITLEELAEFAPQVLIVAMPNVPLGKNVRNFMFFQELKGREQEVWEAIPAMKRGDVFFADGLKQFYNFGTGVIDTIGTVVSAMAGLDSGYITVRNTFLRLRWIELQRHMYIKDAEEES